MIGRCEGCLLGRATDYIPFTLCRIVSVVCNFQISCESRYFWMMEMLKKTDIYILVNFIVHFWERKVLKFYASHLDYIIAVLHGFLEFCIEFLWITDDQILDENFVIFLMPIFKGLWELKMWPSLPQSCWITHGTAEYHKKNYEIIISFWLTGIMKVNLIKILSSYLFRWLQKLNIDWYYLIIVWLHGLSIMQCPKLTFLN